MMKIEALKKINERIDIRLKKIIDQDQIDKRNLELLNKLYELRSWMLEDVKK